MNIQGALGAGYTAKQILNYLASAFPELGHRIKEAVGFGKSAEDILNYISKIDHSKLGKVKGRSNVVKPFQNTSQVNPLLEGQRSVKEYDPIPQGLKTAAKVGATALAGTAAAPLINKGVQAAGPVVGELLGKVFNQGEQQPHAPVPQEQSIIPQTQESLTVTENPEDFLNKYDMKNRVDTMLQAGNSPEQISTLLKQLLRGKIKKNELDSLDQAVQQYSQKSQPIAPQEMAVKDIEKIDKGSEVLTPNGIAKVISTSGENALIEEDGKKKQVKLSQITASPLPEKELANLYEDLVRGVEKKTGQDVSRMVSFAGYDPERNELVFKPHDGAVYIYNEIDPEDVELLTNFLTQRKSTGSNFIGSWQAGTQSPIGAAMSALIKKLQTERGGKGKEYIRKYQTIYDYLEPAIKAKKDEERKKRKAKK